MLGVRSEKGYEKLYILVWNRVRVLRTVRHTTTQNFGEYHPWGIYWLVLNSSKPQEQLCLLGYNLEFVWRKKICVHLIEVATEGSATVFKHIWGNTFWIAWSMDVLQNYILSYNYQRKLNSPNYYYYLPLHNYHNIIYTHTFIKHGIFDIIFKLRTNLIQFWTQNEDKRSNGIYYKQSSIITLGTYLEISNLLLAAAK